MPSVRQSQGAPAGRVRPLQFPRTTATDPVCGQTVTIARAPMLAEVRGEQHYFCSVERGAAFAEQHQYCGHGPTNESGADRRPSR